MSGFSHLPTYLKTQIDQAFETAAASGRVSELPAPHKKRKTDALASSRTGDFVVGGSLNRLVGGSVVENPETAGGGFIVDDTEVGSLLRTHIPLSCIPTALQLLDLQPDDDEVLSVFRNAASGWTRPQSCSVPDGNLEQDVVSREDWRAVCAVLLEPHGVGRDGDGDGGPGLLQLNLDEESDAHDENDVYSNAEESDFDGSDEEYIQGTSPSRLRAQLKSKSARKPRTSSPHSPSASVARKLTSRQTEECRRAFALFFPDVLANSDELDRKKIMIKDISRVATVLKEKITAEEIVEMLEAFSTSADKSVSLRDFERMMVTAKLA